MPSEAMASAVVLAIPANPCSEMISSSLTPIVSPQSERHDQNESVAAATATATRASARTTTAAARSERARAARAARAERRRTAARAAACKRHVARFHKNCVCARAADIDSRADATSRDALNTVEHRAKVCRAAVRDDVTRRDASATSATGCGHATAVTCRPGAGCVPSYSDKST